MGSKLVKGFNWVAFHLVLGGMLMQSLTVASQSSVRAGQNIVVLFEQLDDAASGRRVATKIEKGRMVYDALFDHAASEQERVRSHLNAAGVHYKSYCIVNAISLEADADLVRDLRSFREIKMVLADVEFRVPIREPSFIDIDPNARSKEIPWGLSLIGADKVWELGVQGAGAVVGGHDTGVDWTHPALRDNYRGWNGTNVEHDYNWHDAIHEISPLHGDSIITETTNPCGLSVDFPCDDIGSSHGTHTVGTMVGYDSIADTRIGVAPRAKWIGVRNMERGYGSLASYLEGFEWFLAPTDLDGEHPDPSKAPHVINNSWACIPLEGCHPENFFILETAINNLRKAGIVVVASAGNSGAGGCNTIGNPAAIFEGSLTVGSVDESDSLSSFSSRGLVVTDSSFRIKPNVTAPGRGVLSAVRGGAYHVLTGTSMAGPHVAGLVALMISANPSLAGQVDQIEDIIERTAIKKNEQDSCSTAGLTPNAMHGYGRIDALAAVQEAMVTVPILEDHLTSEFRVFPNPAVGEIYVEFFHRTESAIVRVVDARGRSVFTRSVRGGELLVDVALWPRGMYFVQLLNAGIWMKAQKLQLF